MLSVVVERPGGGGFSYTNYGRPFSFVMTTYLFNTYGNHIDRSTFWYQIISGLPLWTERTENGYACTAVRELGGDRGLVYVYTCGMLTVCHSKLGHERTFCQCDSYPTDAVSAWNWRKARTRSRTRLFTPCPPTMDHGAHTHTHDFSNQQLKHHRPYRTEQFGAT